MDKPITGQLLTEDELKEIKDNFKKIRDNNMNIIREIGNIKEDRTIENNLTLQINNNVFVNEVIYSGNLYE